MKIYGKEKQNEDFLRKAIKVDALAEGWKQYYQQILQS